MREKRTIFKL